MTLAEYMAAQQKAVDAALDRYRRVHRKRLGAHHFMLADFSGSLAAHGAWWYRRLFWEAGLVGQVLYLEAEAAGIRATGIGCFFDDLTHRTFDIKDDRFQVLYHFTMGGALDDARIETVPPYGHLTAP